MEKEIKDLEETFENIRQEIKLQDFHVKSKSGLLDDLMINGEASQNFIQQKSKEISALMDKSVKEYKGDKKELEMELTERAKNFSYEMAFLILGNKLK